jgi:hypothetical protein
VFNQARIFFHQVTGRLRDDLVVASELGTSKPGVAGRRKLGKLLNMQTGRVC